VVGGEQTVPALRCPGQFDTELTRLDEASSSQSSAKSLGLENGPLPQQSWARPAHRAWVTPAAQAHSSTILLPKEASLPLPSLEAPSSPQRPLPPQGKKEGS
jgi:hypothetical protein